MFSAFRTKHGLLENNWVSSIKLYCDVATIFFEQVNYTVYWNQVKNKKWRGEGPIKLTRQNNVFVSWQSEAITLQHKICVQNKLKHEGKIMSQYYNDVIYLEILQLTLLFIGVKENI